MNINQEFKFKPKLACAHIVFLNREANHIDLYNIFLTILNFHGFFVCLGCGLLSAPLMIPHECLNSLKTDLDGAHRNQP